MLSEIGSWRRHEKQRKTRRRQADLKEGPICLFFSCGGRQSTLRRQGGEICGIPARVHLPGVICERRTICHHWLMFTEFLSTSDAQRVSLLLEKLSAYGFRGGALTGSLAIEAHLLSPGRNTERRYLNDLDFIVGSFASIPGSLADGFLVHHIHPHAPEGSLLIQLIDREQALRIDLFG